MPREIPIGGPDAIANETIEPSQIGTSSNRPTAYVDQIDAQSAVGLAELDDNGEVLSSALPDLAITETYTVADKSERLSLAAEEGDVAIQQDVSETYIFTGGDPSVDSNWSAFDSPPAPVQSVYGRTGDVTAQPGDYAISDIDKISVSAILEGTDANKPAAGTAGRYYYATDKNIIYRDNGSTWTVWGGTGTESNPVPGTTHLQSVSTDIQEVRNQTSDSTESSSGFDVIARATDGVGTSATTILTNADIAIGFVVGVNQADVNDRFVDRFASTFGGGGVSTAEWTAKNAATRTYEMSGGTLQLSMSSDTYNVRVITHRIDKSSIV